MTTSRSGLRHILRFLAPYKARILAALVALVVAASAVLVLGQGLRFVIDAGFGNGSQRQLNLALIGMVSIAAVMALASYARFYLMMSTGERVITDIRRAVFSHILTLSPSFYEGTRTGEIISRLTNDVTLVQSVIGSGFSMFLRNALMMIGAMILLIVTSPKLAALIVIGVPLTLAPILVLGKRVRRMSRHTQDRIADVSAYIDEAVHEVRTVQAYAHEDVDRVHFGERAEAAYESAVARIRDRGLLFSSVLLIAFCAIGIVLWIGGRDVLAGNLTAGELSAFVFYAVIVASGAGTVSEVWGDLLRAAGATERIVELLATRPDIVAPPKPLVLPQRVRGEVSFIDTRFAYPARLDAPALDGFDLQVRAGERVALVGASGAGKSTVLALLLRFYDPQAGRVCIDGFDLAQCDPRAVRRQMALVAQDPVIFAASVAENVRYGRPDASMAEVHAACETAYAIEFIEQLPEGFNTELGERGVRLSGGQRQRLALARALLADRPILLLDEATSALDAESERYVQLALERLMRGRTTLVVAHRLATVRNADRIVIMDRGRIVDQGTHAELIRAGGLYARLAALQFIDAAPVG